MFRHVTHHVTRCRHSPAAALATRLAPNLAANWPARYPPLPPSTISVASVLCATKCSQESDTKDTAVQRCQESPFHIAGIISAIRKSSRRLWFIDLTDSHLPASAKIQLMVDYKTQSGLTPNLSPDEFYDQMAQLHKGDSIACSGTPFTNPRGQTGLSLDSLPTLLAPIQSVLPNKLVHKDKINKNKIIAYRVTQDYSTLILRNKLLWALRQFLYTRDFIEVETPILTSIPTSSNASKFITTTNDTSKKNLFLRIAPELMLKRLVISGLPKIFEIGKNFRNEGIDSTHNPEFTTIETYETFKDLPYLIEFTESLWKHLFQHLDLTDHPVYKALQQNNWQFQKVSFLETFQKKTNIDLSTIDLANTADLLDRIPPHDKRKLPPNLNTLPMATILDKLSSFYIESISFTHSHLPTLIYDYPTVLSPLSKHKNGHVANRFEVFINGIEYVNAYEEQNCPQSQLDAFTAQDPTNIDHDFIDAMKLGMPPTVGFGMGIDRFLMLISNTKRIEDVLPLGSLDDL
ncbi:hypothetical protein TBLA_0E03680 [Henningerozyma blattae CBS 6284]|uniref:Aminoacyl-transfer RNA synthetases class-II family profile domain-containing protein n=1 Tax=Henningerozyma blattae (strain ATCC 34711 / CBS 6284 / DSM 70876 / NBRC 10599 / NRRL Y-10934 / UCD 77-7) TaxID=1071380 RepID=I2H4X0_HENB6|nr:hypothetical protein TBLA_0E03680 [Tetrapisispora blattae CBS 6284]CCH61422.1 hypothetical protein TBLA_0E03680 [Tetrapisispora blattae CBS 6284]